MKSSELFNSVRSDWLHKKMAEGSEKDAGYNAFSPGSAKQQHVLSLHWEQLKRILPLIKNAHIG